MSEAILDHPALTWPVSWPKMHKQTEPKADSPDPDQQRHPADQRLVSSNKGLLFAAIKVWVVCYAAKANQCKLTTVFSIPAI